MFKKIANDIVSGENIDAYLIIAASILYFAAKIAVYFGIFYINLRDVESILVIGLLGVMAIAILKSRSIERGVLIGSRHERRYFLSEFPSSFNDEIKSAQSILIVAVTVDLFSLDENISMLHEKLQLGHKIRVLLVKPDKSSLEMAVGRARWETNKNDLKNRIERHLNTLSAINKDSRINKIEIRTINNPLSYSAILTEQRNKTSKSIYLAHYPYKTERIREPKHYLKDGEDSCFSLFQEELEQLWGSGQDWRSLE